MNAPDLGTEARKFAEKLQTLLNKTVCDYALVGAVVNKRTKSTAHVGTRLDRDDLSTTAVEMRSPGREKIWVDVSSVVYLNDEGYLTMRSSYCGIWFGDDHQDLLLHYDYERNKDLYTEAHVQVGASHPSLERYLASAGRDGDHLKDLHWPVGGRRLRPSLEDLLESLIAERMIDPKAGAQGVLDQSRREYREKQISALVRSNQDVSVETLRRLGYEVKKKEPGLLAGRLRRPGRRG